MAIHLSEFLKAPQVTVTMPELVKADPGFISIAQYPRAFEPEDDEFGMIVRDGDIWQRYFSHGD